MIAVLNSESSYAPEQRWEGYTKERKTKRNQKDMRNSEESEKHTRNWIVAMGDEWFKGGYRDCMHGQPKSRFSVLLHHLPCSFVILITSVESKNKRNFVPATQIHYLTASYLSYLLSLTHSSKKDTLAEGSYYPSSKSTAFTSRLSIEFEYLFLIMNSSQTDTI